MRFASSCLLLVLLAVSSEAAVLVRFINTVPQRLDKQPLTVARTNGYEAVGVAGAASAYNHQVDRVGLQYYPSQSSRTIVWTELVDETRAEVTPATAAAPFAYTFAMPPLRGAHRFNDLTAKGNDIDTVALYSAAQFTANGMTDDPTIATRLEQTTLKGDGVSGYLSFAAGTYRMSAYGVLGLSTLINDITGINSQSRVDYADSTFTFEDNKVYTLIAYGNGALAATPVGTGNTVKLALITESVAPTTFAMASIRFFHAVERASAVSLTVTSTTATTTTTLASSISFGTVSNYMDFKPSKSVHFSVSRSDSPSKDETDVTQVHDIRAGLRATLVCAVSNLEAPQVFCRMIPSRVVAYVRMIHDAADKQQLVQGKFGPQKLAETRLSLWATFEYPRPEDPQQWSQDMGDTVSTGHPLTTRGLYPVVQNVAGNTVSGYGEVHVPVFIMDFAVRYIVGYSTVTVTAANAAKNVMANRGDTAGTNNWFYYAPIFKRVSFIIKTEGYATMQPEQAGVAVGTVYAGVDAGGGNIYHAGSFAATGANNLDTAILTDVYVEPGEFYTVLAIGNTRTGQLEKLQSDAMIRTVIRKDLSIDDVHSDLLTASGSVVFVPIAKRIAGNDANTQLFGNINIAGPGASGTNQIRSFDNTGVLFRTPLINTVFADAVNTAGTYGWPTTVRALQLNAGTYTYSQATNTATCQGNLPSGSFTITNGVRTEIFVLNTEGCAKNSGTTLSNLVTVVTTMQSATASGHAPATTTVTTREARAVPFYSAASSVSAMSLSFLLAAIMAIVALW